MNTDTITDPVLVVDYTMSLADMIEAGKYDWVSRDITEDKFPVIGIGTMKFRARLFELGRDISSEDAVAAMKKENFTPATHVHGLAFGAAFPDEQRKYPIACLGSSARVYGGRRYVVCVRGDGGERAPSLYCWDAVWDDYWSFLGVQKVSDA